MTRGGGGVTSLGQSPKKYQQSYSGGDTIPTVNPIPSHTFIIASSGRSTYHHVILISTDSFKGKVHRKKSKKKVLVLCMYVCLAENVELLVFFYFFFAPSP